MNRDHISKFPIMLLEEEGYATVGDLQRYIYSRDEVKKYLPSETLKEVLDELQYNNLVFVRKTEDNLFYILKRKGH